MSSVAPHPVVPRPVARPDDDLPGEIQALAAAGRWNEARERYGELVARLQRRAFRLAVFYLRDAADADEVVQDAFVKAYAHMASFDRTRSFEIWFSRILVNTCLDRVKARKRRQRWQMALGGGDAIANTASRPADVSPGVSPEVLMLRRERARTLLTAIRQLPTRQRAVVMLSHLDGRTTREVSEMTGLSESTVRVHLFRGLRKLRTMVARG